MFKSEELKGHIDVISTADIVKNSAKTTGRVTSSPWQEDLIFSPSRLSESDRGDSPISTLEG